MGWSVYGLFEGRHGETAVRWGGVCMGRHGGDCCEMGWSVFGLFEGRHGGDCCEMGWSVYGLFEGRHGETAVRWGGVCLGSLRADMGRLL